MNFSASLHVWSSDSRRMLFSLPVFNLFSGPWIILHIFSRRTVSLELIEYNNDDKCHASPESDKGIARIPTPYHLCFGNLLRAHLYASLRRNTSGSHTRMHTKKSLCVQWSTGQMRDRSTWCSIWGSDYDPR